VAKQKMAWCHLTGPDNVSSGPSIIGKQKEKEEQMYNFPKQIKSSNAMAIKQKAIM